MTDHTPTTEEVQNKATGQNVFSEPLTHSQFTAWLAAHERKIAAEAWQEGWDACVEYMNGPDWGQTLPNPYRAARIEQGGES